MDIKKWINEGKTWQKCLVAIIFIFLIVLIIGAITSGNNSNKTTINVTNLNINSGGYGSYDLTCNLLPDKDYSYLEIVVIFYDSNGNIIDKNPLVWNMNNIKKGEPIKVTGHCYLSGDNVPAKAKVLFFDSSINNDESKAIYVQEINM